MIRVLVVDDDVMVQRAILDYLRIAGDIEVVGVCGSAQEALDALATVAADVVLMDIHMAGTDGIAATRSVLAAQPEVRVLMLTSHVDDTIVRSAMEAGASGFLLKTVTPAGLVDAVRGTSRGLRVMSDASMRTIHQRPPARPTGPAPDLTERELAVLRHLCEGLSNAEISSALFMSESSVKGYVTSVLRKLDVPTRLKAVVRAHELGLDGS